MQAIRIHEHGGPEVLRLEELPDPAPGPGEVVLRVTACALNHVDVDIREGTSRFPLPFPHTPGLEPVGRVEAVGAGVEGWSIGDRAHVYLYRTCGSCRWCRGGTENLCPQAGIVGLATDGGYATHLRCPASMLIPVPDELGDAEAAATPIAFATAWHMLFTMGGLRAGETVLINSVASGIGSAALQLATLAGAFTIGTASTQEKLDRATALGLERALDYTRESVPDAVMEATGGAGADLVFEHVGGDSFQRGLDSLARNGRMVIAGGHAGEVVPFDIIPFFRGQKRVLGSSAFTSDEVRTVLALAAHGRVQPLVHATFPLAEARAATELLESRNHFGKVVLVP